MTITGLCITLGVLISLSATQSADPTCGDPPEIEFASVTSKTQEENPIGTTIRYACQFGYVVDRAIKSSYCELTEDEMNAEWSKPQMSCIPRSCGDPGFVSKGHRVGSLFTFSNSVSYQCDQGYRLVGKGTRYCHASGSWSGTLPRCDRIFCDVPKDPEHGQATYKSLEFGSELKFKCDTVYRLNNTEPVTCTETGTWSRTQFKCVEAACDIPLVPEHGSVKFIHSSSKPLAGTIAFFSCKGDRIPDGPTMSKCLDIGEWTFPAPKCLEPCKIPAVPNGKIGRYAKSFYNRNFIFSEIPVGSYLDDNEKLFLQCTEGYRPLGSTDWQVKVICSGGKWLNEPYCEPSACLSDPPQVWNARAEIIDSKHGGTVNYECFHDFAKESNGSVTCQFGKWKGATPSCKDSRCSTTALNFPGVEKGGKTFYRSGEELEIICSRPYSLEEGHSGYIKCENGVWKSNLTPCVTGKCFLEDLKYSEGVSPDTQLTTNSGDRLNVQCSDGYTQKYFLPTCINGQWTWNTVSPCRKTDECEVLQIPNARIKEQKIRHEWRWSSFSFEEKVTFENVPYGVITSREMSLFFFCDYGYHLQGTKLENVAIHCSEEKWSPDSICILRKSCSSESLISALPLGISADMQDVTNDMLSSNSTVRLMCDGDLILVGNPVAKCLIGGKWEIDIVRCESGYMTSTESSESEINHVTRKLKIKFYKFFNMILPSWIISEPGTTKNHMPQNRMVRKDSAEIVDRNIFDDYL